MMRVRFQEGLLRVSETEIHRMIDALRGRLLIRTPDEWDDLKDLAADALEELLLLRGAVYDDGK